MSIFRGSGVAITAKSIMMLMKRFLKTRSRIIRTRSSQSAHQVKLRHSMTMSISKSSSLQLRS